MKESNFRRYAVSVLTGFIFGAFINSALAETLSTEEKDMIEELDLYTDYSFWKDASGDEILTVSKDDWEMLEKVAYEMEEGDKNEE